MPALSHTHQTAQEIAIQSPDKKYATESENRWKELRIDVQSGNIPQKLKSSAGQGRLKPAHVTIYGLVKSYL